MHNNFIKTWVKNASTHFSKEDMQMTSRYMKRCSASLIIREMQIKTIMRYHLIPVMMAFSLKSNCYKDMEKMELLHG